MGIDLTKTAINSLEFSNAKSFAIDNKLNVYINPGIFRRLLLIINGFNYKRNGEFLINKLNEDFINKISQDKKLPENANIVIANCEKIFNKVLAETNQKTLPGDIQDNLSTAKNQIKNESERLSALEEIALQAKNAEMAFFAPTEEDIEAQKNGELFKQMELRKKQENLERKKEEVTATSSGNETQSLAKFMEDHKAIKHSPKELSPQQESADVTRRVLLHYQDLSSK